jgi:transaldolase
MKFFLDTADVADIRHAAALGLIDGVTTNPSLIARTGRPFGDVIREICDLVDGPVSAETVSRDYEGIMREAHHLAKIHKNIVVKIPIFDEGLQAVRRCTAEGIRTNVTLIFSPNQALLAAKAGATFVSPFAGRLDDTGIVGTQVIRQMVDIFRTYAFKSEVLVASIRDPLHVTEAALAGAHICTIPPAVLKALSKHPLTDIGLEKFLADWKTAKKDGFPV